MYLHLLNLLADRYAIVIVQCLYYNFAIIALFRYLHQLVDLISLMHQQFLVMD